MKEAVEQRTVFKEKMAQITVNSENAVTVFNRNKLKRHRGRAIHSVFVAAGGAKPAVAPERDKLEVAAMSTSIHSAAEGWIAAVDHFVYVFDYGRAWTQQID